MRIGMRLWRVLRVVLSASNVGMSMVTAGSWAAAGLPMARATRSGATTTGPVVWPIRRLWMSRRTEEKAVAMSGRTRVASAADWTSAWSTPSSVETWSAMPRARSARSSGFWSAASAMVVVLAVSKAVCCTHHADRASDALSKPRVRKIVPRARRTRRSMAAGPVSVRSCRGSGTGAHDVLADARPGPPTPLPSLWRQGVVPGLVHQGRTLPHLRLPLRAPAGLPARRLDDEHDRHVRPVGCRPTGGEHPELPGHRRGADADRGGHRVSGGARGLLSL